jgi:hypothetical protein
MKYYTIYKTVNLENNKYYIGKHVTADINDDYLGSGVVLTKAIKKYGKESFKKEILFVFQCQEEMNLKERQLVTENIILDKMSYNFALGGQGGNLGKLVNDKIGTKMSILLKGKSKSESHKQALRESKLLYKPTEETKEKIKNTISNTWASMLAADRKTKCGHPRNENGFYNKSHSCESVDKMKKTIGDSRKGSNNPNAKPIKIYGKTYLTRKECLEDLKISKSKLYKILGEK